jgi:hypothetical protein
MFPYEHFLAVLKAYV